MRSDPSSSKAKTKHMDQGSKVKGSRIKAVLVSCKGCLVRCYPQHSDNSLHSILVRLPVYTARCFFCPLSEVGMAIKAGSDGACYAWFDIFYLQNGKRMVGDLSYHWYCAAFWKVERLGKSSPHLFWTCRILQYPCDLYTIHTNNVYPNKQDAFLDIRLPWVSACRMVQIYAWLNCSVAVPSARDTRATLSARYFIMDESESHDSARAWLKAFCIWRSIWCCCRTSAGDLVSYEPRQLFGVSRASLLIWAQAYLRIKCGINSRARYIVGPVIASQRRRHSVVATRDQVSADFLGPTANFAVRLWRIFVAKLS